MSSSLLEAFKMRSGACSLVAQCLPGMHKALGFNPQVLKKTELFQNALDSIKHLFSVLEGI